MPTNTRLLFSIAALFATGVLADAPDSIDRDYRSELPRIQPLEPEEALASFSVAPGFRMELVAAEPLVTDPVAMAFDERGRLFVVEMRGYSEDADEQLGRIRLLIDEDGDGRFDSSQAYAEQLSWPTAIACYDGGVVVGAPPDIIFLKDTDDDGRADQRHVLFTGFSRHNVQGMMNSFQWGLDNRIHGSSGTVGGEVAKVAGDISGQDPESSPDVDSKSLELRGRDFAIEPRSMSLQATSGGGQHGMSFNPWGHKFICSNSDHAQYVLYEDHYLARNPYFAAPSARVSIAEDGPQAAVFRTSPVEPWRIVRTRLRAKGIVPGPVEGGGTPAGYFTSASGLTIYRGNAWPGKYVGWAIVADVGSNLVHRKQISANGASYVARRVDEGTEFVSSSDIWFRPVQFANGPDGALYVADMYREVVEHPASLPPVIKQHLDLTSGRDRGRIYRIVPANFRQPNIPILDTAKTAMLVELLHHTNGWHRDTAARLLHQRQDRTAIAPLRESLQSPASTSVGRLHVLYALDGLGALSDADVLVGLDDKHTHVREHAVRLSEKIAEDSPRVREQLYAMVRDEDLRVRVQLAASLGQLMAPQRLVSLAQLIRRDGGNEQMRVAVMSSLAEEAGQLLAALAEDESYRLSDAGRDWLTALAAQIGKQQNSDDIAAVLAVLGRLSAEDKDALQSIVQGLAAEEGSPLAQQLAAVTGGRAAELMRDLLRASANTAHDVEAGLSARVAAIGHLQLGRFESYHDLLAELLQPSQPAEIPIAAVKALATYRSPAVAQLLIERWPALTPRVRSHAADVLFSRDQWLMPLLNAIDQSHIAAADLGSVRLQLLAEHRDQQIRHLARRLTAESGPDDRKEVVAAYRDALLEQGNSERGKKVFAKVCSVCHRVDGTGHPLGPNLAAMQNRGRESILTNVLDPNREINPQYLNYVVFTEDGRSLTGMIVSETATSVTLQRADNANDTILRVDIEQLQSTGKSIMPEGLEKQVDPQAMTDLIEYLMSVE